MLCAVAVHARSPYRFSKLCGHRADRGAVLDKVIDVSQFRFQYWAENAHHSRRIGLGITWLADFLVMLGLTYGITKVEDRIVVWPKLTAE